MPQIEQLATTYASQIFWLLVFFGIIFFVIGRGMVPKVMATMDGRDKQIADDLAAAEAARATADAEEESWRVQANKQRAEAQAPPFSLPPEVCHGGFSVWTALPPEHPRPLGASGRF